MTRTGKSPVLARAAGEPSAEIHPEDARAAGVDDGEDVRLVSRRGQVTARAELTEAVPRGHGVRRRSTGARCTPRPGPAP